MYEYQWMAKKKKKNRPKNCVQTNGITSLKECVLVCVFKMIYDICVYGANFGALSPFFLSLSVVLFVYGMHTSKTQILY